MSDWADEKAREFCAMDSTPGGLRSLAASYRAVAKDKHITAEALTKLKAEVRRVVEDVRDHHLAEFLDRDDALNAVLSRLERL